MSEILLGYDHYKLASPTEDENLLDEPSEADWDDEPTRRYDERDTVPQLSASDVLDGERETLPLVEAGVEYVPLTESDCAALAGDDEEKSDG